MAYVIDKYNKYDANDRAVTRYIYYIFDQPWAIKEYDVVNGQLMRPLGFEEQESTNNWFYIYDNIEQAQAYIRKLKELNR